MTTSIKSLYLFAYLLAATCFTGFRGGQALAKDPAPGTNELDTQNTPQPEDRAKALNEDFGAPDPTAHLYAVGLGLGLSVCGSVTWKFYKSWTGKFRVIDEGWFGRGTYAGGADKLGHVHRLRFGSWALCDLQKTQLRQGKKHPLCIHRRFNSTHDDGGC